MEIISYKLGFNISLANGNQPNAYYKIDQTW